MNDIPDVVVIGAGWAGLSISHGLSAVGISHVVLERGRIAETWRSQRWNSFRFNIPRVLTLMPGDRYDGTDPEGAMTRDEFVSMLEDYASRHALPVHAGENVEEVSPGPSSGYQIRTSRGTFQAPSVVVASGNLNRPRRPALARQIPAAVRQIDASDYRSPDDLEAGSVLVVGSGQSGGQIAKDLVEAGRKVFLATSRVGRLPRRYRGRDLALWVVEGGLLNVRREDLVLPSGAYPARPLQGATETLSLQFLSVLGVVLLGRLAAAEGTTLRFADDVADNIQYGDEASVAVRRRVDDYIARAGIAAPAATDDPAEIIAADIPTPPITALDLQLDGIATIIWCTGFDGDFSWLRIPHALGSDRQPSQVNGIGVVEGLYFAGLDFGATRKSGTILAAAEEAQTIVAHIRGRMGRE